MSTKREQITSQLYNSPPQNQGRALPFLDMNSVSNELYFSPQNISTPISVDCDNQKFQSNIPSNHFDISNFSYYSPYCQLRHPMRNQYGPPISNQYIQPISNQYLQPISNQQLPSISRQHMSPISNRYSQQPIIDHHQSSPVNNRNSRSLSNQYSSPISARYNQQSISDQLQSTLANFHSQPIIKQNDSPISIRYSQQPISEQPHSQLANFHSQPIIKQNDSPISIRYSQLPLNNQHYSPMSNRYSQQPITDHYSIDKLTSSIYPPPLPRDFSPDSSPTSPDGFNIPETRRRVARYAFNVDENLYQNQYTNEKALRNSGTELSTSLFSSGNSPSPKSSIMSNPYCSPMVARRLLTYQQNSTHSLVRTR